METNEGIASCLTRHHMDAGDRHSHTEQRRPPPVPRRPQLGSGSLAGASLFCWVTGSLVEATSSVHHTPAWSPAGTRSPGAARLLCQGQLMLYSVQMPRSWWHQLSKTSEKDGFELRPLAQALIFYLGLSHRSSMWAETPKMLQCLFTTSTNWPPSSQRSALFRSFCITSWRAHVSSKWTDFKSRCWMYR